MLRKIHIVLWLACVSFFSLHAQDIGELTQALENAKTNEEKFHALTKLSDYWSYRDTTKAVETLHDALPLIGGNDFLHGVYLFYEAGIYYGYDNPKSQRLYLQADEYLKKLDTPETYRYRAKLWHNYGALEQQANNDKAFLDITLTRCIPYALKSGDNDLLMSYFTDVGMVFYNHNEYDKALEYYDKAVSLVRSPDYETENLLWTYVNMFDAYLYRGEKEKARRILLKAEELLEKIPEKKLAGIFYKNKAKFLNLEGNYTEALRSIDAGMQIATEYNFYWDFVSLKYEKAQIYKTSGNWQSAKTELEELLSDPRGTALGKSHLALINELSDIEARLGNYSRAYELMQNHKKLNDSISAMDFKQQLADMETRYRTAEKEQEIVLLESKNRLHRTLFFGAILFTVLLILWIWYAWSTRKRRNEKDALMQRQQREIDVSKALMDGEEQERKRLARDLHDGLVGRVTGLKMNVERIARDSRQKELPDVVAELETVITELRHTAHNLEPSVLKNQGLEEAIRHFCQSLQSPKTAISFYANGLSAVSDKNLQLSVYRIVQELVTNAIRHAEATQIILQCSAENRFLLIEIEDNGKGFNPDTVSRNMGLNNLEARVKSIGGTMKIDSRPGEGTQIQIESQL